MDELPSWIFTSGCTSFLQTITYAPCQSLDLFGKVRYHVNGSVPKVSTPQEQERCSEVANAEESQSQFGYFRVSYALHYTRELLDHIVLERR